MYEVASSPEFFYRNIRLIVYVEKPSRWLAKPAKNQETLPGNWKVGETKARSNHGLLPSG